jgi:FkbM family methyltransferase
VLRIISGTYEPEQTVLFQRLIQPGQTVLDVGAHVGYYTLLAATLVGRAGNVHAFEPNPRNARFLARHLRINGIPNVTVTEAAVAAAEATARFDFGSGSGTGHLAVAGPLEVRVTSLDHYCREHAVTPAAIKIDVEGGELDVLAGADAVLAQRPTLFLSTHGARVHAECLTLLRLRGYRCEPILGEDIATTTELLCRAA